MNTDTQFERRKKVLYDMICDKQYIPMKIKEIAILRPNKATVKTINGNKFDHGNI